MRLIVVVVLSTLLGTNSCDVQGVSYACELDRDCPVGERCVLQVCSSTPAVEADGGALDDAGAGAADGGVPDGGSSPGDGGTVATDAGASGGDAGAPLPDAGPAPACGDDARQGGEQCDDGNVVERDGCSSACRVWWDEAFPVRMRVTLRSPAAGPVDAPVGLALPTALFPSGAPRDRACVVASDQRTVLPVEIERAATATDEALLWTRLVLPSGDSELFVYFGSDASCAGSQGAVWQGYAGVFHFEGSVDSTASIPLSAAGTGTTAAAAGIRGAALDVDTTAWPQVTPPGALWITGSVTLEVWGRLSAFGAETSWENTLFQAAGGSAAQAYFLNIENSGRLRGYWEDSNFDALSTAACTLALGQWHHYVMVRDNTADTVRFYVDGAALGDAIGFAGPPSDAAGSSSFIYFGGNFTSVGRRFTGTLDEVRVAPAALSADAIAVSHAASKGALVVATVREPSL